MSTRSPVLLSFAAAALAFAPAARADIPASSSSGTTASSSSSAGGTGGSTTSPYDPNCTAGSEESSGSTCKSCAPSACGALGSDYNLVCKQSASLEVWCNGPKRTSPADQNVACAVSNPGGTLTGAAVAGAIAAIAGLFLRRRRQG